MGSGIAFSKLVIAITGRLIVIRRTDRSDTPHLTISFKNTSGEIDLHLKHESPRNDETSTYTPILTLSKAKLEEFLESFFEVAGEEIVNVFLNNTRKIRPGWLGRKGYVIALFDPEDFKQSIYSTAPKQQGKYRVNEKKLKDLFTNVDLSKVTLHHPSVLHELTVKNSNPIYAIRDKGKRRIIPLILVRHNNGKGLWLTFDRLLTETDKVFQKITPSHLREQLKDTWYRVFDALRLDELGITRD